MVLKLLVVLKESGKERQQKEASKEGVGKINLAKLRWTTLLQLRIMTMSRAGWHSGEVQASCTEPRLIIFLLHQS